MEKKQIYWLDSVKGIACWMVFLGHFNTAFGYLPFINRWVDAGKYSSFLISGATALNMFYIVFAFLAARSFLFRSEDYPLRAGKAVVKRYFRLAIPVFIVEVLVFAVQKTGLWTGRFETMPARNISFGEILYDSFIGSMFHGSANVYDVFWMMNKLFIGYIFVLIMCMIVIFMSRPFRYFILTVVTASLLFLRNEYFPMVYGIILYMMYRDIYDEESPVKRKKLPCIFGGAILLIISTFCSGWNEHLAYRFRDSSCEFLRLSYVYCWIAAVLIMTGLILCSPVLKLLDNRKLALSGKICFPVYLFHKLCMLTVGDCAFRFFDARSSGYINHGVKAAFFVSVTSVVVMSVLYVRFIEPLINRLIAFIIRAMEKRRENGI